MARITFIEPAGVEHVIDADTGPSLMEAAVKNRVQGIIAECGGVCSCGTCRVYLESKASQEIVGVPTADERDMMQFVGETRADARLSCQIPVTAELDGLVVRVALRQRQT